MIIVKYKRFSSMWLWRRCGLIFVLLKTCDFASWDVIVLLSKYKIIIK
jgi:hypothetical protein